MAWRGVTRADVTLLITVTLCSAVLFVAFHLFGPRGSTVEIRSGDNAVIRHPLEEDRIIEINGPVGRTIIEISGGHVRVESAPCHDKICMHMGPIGRQGGLLVCIPNRVVVAVVNDQSDVVDAMTR